MFVLIFSIFLLINFLIIVVRHAMRRREFMKFPQTHNIFLIGDIAVFLKRPLKLHFIQRLHELAENFTKKDKLFCSFMTTIPAIFLFNKDYVKKILSKNDDDFLRKGVFIYKSINDAIPNSLLTIDSKDDKWRIRRKILSPPFHTTNLENFSKIVNFESKKLINYFKKNPCDDLINEMKKTTMLIFTKLLFEYDLEYEIDSAMKLTDNVTDIMTRKSISIFLISPFLYRLTSLATEEVKISKELMNFKNKLLNSKIETSKERLQFKLENDRLESSSSNLTLIEILLKNFKNTINEKTKQWSGFEMDEIKAQLDTFIVAGFDTASSALTFLLYHLAKYPNYQDQIYEEINQVVGNADVNHQLTLEEVKKMVFLEAFINESLRIEPIAPIIARLSDKDILLDEKYTIPKNTDIVILIGKILNDPDYFPEPEVFKPERFLEDQSQNMYTNIPFSAGVRNCVAKKIALHVLSFVSANLVRNFKIEFADSFPEQLRLNLAKKFELVNKPVEKIQLKFISRT